jgi:hypothetical protein
MAETVTVACKLPNGLMIRVGDQEQRLNGPARFITPQPGRVNLNPIEDIVYNAGFTVVDKQLWDAWLKDHKLYEPVKTGHVYAMPNRNEATAKAKDFEKKATGLEPIDPLAKGTIEATDETLRILAKSRG